MCSLWIIIGQHSKSLFGWINFPDRDLISIEKNVCLLPLFQTILMSNKNPNQWFFRCSAISTFVLKRFSWMEYNITGTFLLNIRNTLKVTNDPMCNADDKTPRCSSAINSMKPKWDEKGNTPKDRKLNQVQYDMQIITFDTVLTEILSKTLLRTNTISQYFLLQFEILLDMLSPRFDRRERTEQERGGFRWRYQTRIPPFDQRS